MTLPEELKKAELPSNNCVLCHIRIFILSGGTTECADGCPNNLKKLMYGYKVESVVASFLENKKKELQNITTEILTSLSTLAVSINKPTINNENMKNIIDCCNKADAILTGGGK